MDKTETALVKRVQSGDLHAYEELLDIHSHRLRAFIALKLPISHLIDEIAHESFIFAHANIQKFDPYTDFGKWLRAIAFNLIRREVQRYRRKTMNEKNFFEHVLVSNEAGFDADNDELIVFLEECIKRLPDNQQKLLRLKYEEGENSIEMSEELGQSRAWVRTTLCRIRSALKKCVESKIAVSQRLS